MRMSSFSFVTITTCKGKLAIHIPRGVINRKTKLILSVAVYSQLLFLINWSVFLYYT